jgi:16S rRNA C967 or C1407 C5-methylase (RsmB/RsmF family)/NOL1/NOP2/fmu family ribosome biogenesis protein
LSFSILSLVKVGFFLNSVEIADSKSLCMSSLNLPVSFQTQMQAILGNDEYPDFLDALSSPAPLSVRLNPKKSKKYWENYDGVKWHHEGVYLKERPSFTLDPSFQAGAYYVQEASSMLIGAAIAQAMDLTKPIMALDLAAAPGGKSTLLASLISAESMLIANEVIKSRYQILRQNLIKWGYPNVVCTNQDSREFAPLNGQMDLVLLDAPCSGEGLFRKDPEAIGEWSPEHVQHCAARQRRIMADAAALLAPGGILLYSTCTYNDAENSDNVLWAQNNLGLNLKPLTFPKEWGLTERKAGFQAFPHRLQGEGFFFALLQKETLDAPEKTKNPTGFWKPLPAKQAPDLKTWLQNSSNFSYLGSPHGELAALPVHAQERLQPMLHTLKRWDPVLEIGSFKGKDLVPAHALALSTALNDQVPHLDVDLEQALHFLRKEQFVPAPGGPKGWAVVQYEGSKLGWVKVLPDRINNYYPKDWRILMSS